jgi:hypothetical protein
MATASRRYPLLLYDHLYALWRLPALMVALLAFGLAWWAPGPLAGSLVARGGLAMTGALAAIVCVYALIGPRLAYVQCRPTYLLLRTPLFRLAISYSRVRTTRPIPFNPAITGWGDSRFVDPLRGRTQVAVDLSRYPISRRWLRLWLLRYLLPADFLGLQLLVHDWMSLSRDIESHRAEWKSLRRGAEREPPLTSLTMRRRF